MRSTTETFPRKDTDIFWYSVAVGERTGWKRRRWTRERTNRARKMYIGRFDYGLVARCVLRNFYGWYMNKVSFLFKLWKTWTKQKINFPIIKVFPKDTSFFSLPHARRRPFRRATVAIWKDIKRACAEYAVRAISRIYSAIETSLRRLKRKRFGIVAPCFPSSPIRFCPNIVPISSTAPIRTNWHRKLRL